MPIVECGAVSSAIADGFIALVLLLTLPITVANDHSQN
jgi:hypothetical protein